MREIRLVRVSTSTRCTTGVFIDSEKGVPFLCSLEKPWVQNLRSESCIPEGRYNVIKYNSEKYKDVYEVLNVPGRSYILIHPGNFVEDTYGCILPGKSWDRIQNRFGVTSSRDSLEVLKKHCGDKFTLVVTSV